MSRIISVGGFPSSIDRRGDDSLLEPRNQWNNRESWSWKVGGTFTSNDLLWTRSYIANGGVSGFGTTNNIGNSAPQVWDWRQSLRAKGIKSRKTISGTTVNQSGAPLGNVRVQVYHSYDDVIEDWTMSDALSGAFSLYVTTNDYYYCVAYLPGTPDRVGDTVNTLTGV